MAWLCPILALFLGTPHVPKIAIGSSRVMLFFQLVSSGKKDSASILGVSTNRVPKKVNFNS